MRSKCDSFFDLLKSNLSKPGLQHYYAKTLVPRYRYHNVIFNEILNEQRQSIQFQTKYTNLLADYQDEVYNLIKSDLLAEWKRLKASRTYESNHAHTTTGHIAANDQRKLLSASADKAKESNPSAQCRIKPYKWIMAISLITAWMQIY